MIIFLAILSCFLLLLLTVISVILIFTIKKYKSVSNMFSFYDELLGELIGTAINIDETATRVLNENLIEGIPEVKQLFIYVRKMRNTFRNYTKRYNQENKFGNKILIEEIDE